MLAAKRFLIFVVLLSLLAGSGAGCQPKFQPGSYTDDAGRVVSIDKIPQRIVSSVPSVTEMLFALGVEGKVVGVSDYSDYPEEAKLKPSVGSYFNPSIEKIVKLNPDLVLTSGSDKQLMVQLDSLKINYLVINPESIEGILKDIELLGKVTGAGGKARDVVKNMKDRIAQVANKVKGASGVKVFYTFAVTDPNNPWTAGPGSFIDSLITLAGGKNIAAKTVAPYVQFSIEEILRSDPEVIIIGVRHGYLPDTTAEELKKHPVWREISAMKNNQVYNIDGDLVNRSGPRIVQGLEEIASFLYPALFKK